MPGIIDSTYEIIEKLGAGGGGNVYLARHIRLNKKVVLKIDKRKLSTKPEILRREVDVLKNLRHAHIPQVYDFFVEDGSVITVMDYIEGESLDRPLKRGEVFSQAQVVTWAKQVLDALEYMHSPTHGEPPKGYVHSDIKPANIMRLPDNSVCLIDFNISLAIGEYSFVGRSVGYASPEHYGLDYSNPYEDADSDDTQTDSDETSADDSDETMTSTADSQSQPSSAMGGKRILPDVRSDIYSLGATLYHMLCGQRPPRDAKNVVPLPKDKFSPLICDIIAKAMTPNPDLRYQSAAEMRKAFDTLRQKDPRTLKLKRRKRIVISVFSILLAAGLFATFVGLKRIQRNDEILKNAEYSQTALKKGDVNAAIDYALEALPNENKLFDPPYRPQAQKALTDALGVYNLADEYKQQGTVSLESAPLYLSVSPDGTTGACICSKQLVIFDTEKCSITKKLEADPSALSEVEFIDDDTVAYAGSNGLCVYDVKNDKELWCGQKATAIAVSADASTVMGIYRDEGFATVYNAKDGSELAKLDLDGGKQSVLENDSFANPQNNLVELSDDGSYAAVSLSDGRVLLADIKTGDIFTVFDDKSYNSFGGCFLNGYFALTASNGNTSEFELFDIESGELCAQSHSDNGAYLLRCDDKKLFIKEKGVIAVLDTDTGDQATVVDSDEIITQFSISEGHIASLTDNGIAFYTREGSLINAIEGESPYSLCSMSGDICLAANGNDPVIQLFKYDRDDSSLTAQYINDFEHDESRVCDTDGNIMQFNIDHFRIIDKDGNVIAEQQLDTPEKEYDQQFIRSGSVPVLEVTYYDGTVKCYSSKDGSLVETKAIDKPDKELISTFETESYTVTSPLHGAATVKNNKNGKEIGELTKEGYLSYVYEYDSDLIAIFTSDEGEKYGLILDEKLETIAYLPYLTDFYNDKLIFDYPTGSIKSSPIYSIDELIDIARSRQS